MIAPPGTSSLETNILLHLLDIWAVYLGKYSILDIYPIKFMMEYLPICIQGGGLLVQVPC